MISDDTGVAMLICFDHEEIGSDSAQGMYIGIYCKCRGVGVTGGLKVTLQLSQ